MTLGSTREPFLGQLPPSGTAQRPEWKTSLSEEKAYLPPGALAWAAGFGPKHSLPPKKGLGWGRSVRRLLYRQSLRSSACSSSLVCPLKELISFVQQPSFQPGTRENFYGALALVANEADACGSHGFQSREDEFLEGYCLRAQQKATETDQSFTKGLCSFTNRFSWESLTKYSSKGWV